MNKKFLKTVAIGLVIIMVSSIIISFVKPYVEFVSERIWFTLSITFGVTYVATHNLKYNESKISIRNQKIITYLYTWVLVFGIYYGLSFIFQ